MKEGQRYLRTYFVIILDVFKRVVGAVSQCLLLLGLRLSFVPFVALLLAHARGVSPCQTQFYAVLNGRLLSRCYLVRWVAIHLIPKWPLIYAHTNWPLLPRSRQNILLNFKLKNEASRANLNKNKRIFKWRPFWNKVYMAIQK